MRKIIACLLFVFIVYLQLVPQVKNSDKPLLGEYVFALKKIWEVDQAGEDFWGTIYSIQISEDGKICCYDWKNLKYYILDKDGQLITHFGNKGEGPGEIKRIEQAPIFIAGDKIAVSDTGQIHFFDWQGRFINTKRNITGNRPILFLDENTYITAPRTIQGVEEGKAKVEQISLETMDRKLITTFSMYKGGTIQNQDIQAAVVFSGITPVAVVASKDNRLLYGMSDVYRINITDMNGKPLIDFSLNRKKGRVKQQDIVDSLVTRASGRAPRELLERLAKTLPTEETFFTRIMVHKNLIYVFKTDFYATNINQIDIFSQKGEYLYKGLIKVEEGCNIRLPVFTADHLYLVLEDEEGESLLCKYLVTVPEER